MIIDTTKETHRTEAEIELELEEAKRGRIAEEQKLAEEQQRVAAVLEERRRTALSENLKREIMATGLRPYDSPEDLKLVMEKQGIKFNINNNGTFDLTDANGRRVEFGAALESLAKDRRWLFDGRSLHRLDRQEQRGEITRADLKTTAEKSAYISKFGLAAFEALKQRPSGSTSTNVLTMRAADYNRLGLREKSKLIDEYGTAAVQEILRRR